MRRTRTLGAIAVVAAVAAAGCGGGGGPLSKPAYNEKLQAAGRDLVAARAQLSRSKPKEEFEKGVEAVQKGLSDAADELDGISPPTDARSANTRLVAALKQLAKDWDDVKSAADQSPDAAIAKARKVASGRASRDALQAIIELQRRGYDVGELGG